MSPLVFLLPSNVLGFLEKHANKENLKLLLEAKERIDLSSPSIDHYLIHSAFPEVLTALWKEPDVAKKVTWLVSKSEQLHPILLYEEAIAKFLANPTVSQLTTESLPLVDAAHFRLCQDAECSLNSEVKTSVVGRIHELFHIRLGFAAYKHLKIPFFELEARVKKLDICTLKVQEIAKLSLSKELPSPIWLGECGLNVFSVGKPRMVPATLFDPIRKQFAQEQLSTNFFMKKR
jgi:hypothetical protein